MIQEFSCELITMQRVDSRLPLLFYSLDQVQSHEFQLNDIISVLVLELNAVLLFWKSGGLAWSGLEYQKCIYIHIHTDCTLQFPYSSFHGCRIVYGSYSVLLIRR